jgi:predicted ATP-grasp superfamily ATP-dependent carboligase
MFTGMNGKKGVVVIEGHVQGLANTRAFGEAGIPVIVVDRDICLAAFSRYCTKFIRCPDYKTVGFIDLLIMINETYKLDGWMLLPSNDHAVFSISSGISRLRKYYRILTPEFSTLLELYDKERLVRLAVNSNVPVARSYFPKDYSTLKGDKLRFPILVKGKFGLDFYKATGRKAFLVRSDSELKNVIERLTRIIPASSLFLQELIPSSETKTISVGVFSVAGDLKAYWMGEKIREHPARFGTATCARSVHIDELLPLVTRLLRNLSFTGICEIEFLKDPRDNEYKLIEINSRTWLWVGLARQCGINLPIYAFNYLNRIETIFPATYEQNRFWIHYLTDIPFGVVGAIRRIYNFADLLGDWFGESGSPAVFSLTDPLPSVMELVLLPYVILKRGVPKKPKKSENDLFEEVE